MVSSLRGESEEKKKKEKIEEKEKKGRGCAEGDGEEKSNAHALHTLTNCVPSMLTMRTGIACSSPVL